MHLKHYYYYNIPGNNDNPSAAEFLAIYRKLLVCKEIVHRNNYGNCITDDTGILTIASSGSVDKYTSDNTSQYEVFEIEFDYHVAIDEEIEKFDQHLNAFIASTIESNITKAFKRCHKKQCSQCIDVFSQNAKLNDDFITMKMAKDSLEKPCRSTVDIIKATNKILSHLEDQPEIAQMYDRTLKTIMFYLCTEELYTQTDFNMHPQRKCEHREDFISKIVREYMKMKSCKIGSRISEQEKGTYIRHNYKKRIQEAGQ